MATRVKKQTVLVFDREASRAVDRVASEEYAIPAIVLMENAARGAADVILPLVKSTRGRSTKPVAIICGGGNNGGDGLALARHLHNERIAPVILMLDRTRPKSAAAINHAICRSMRLNFATSRDDVDLNECALVVDAIFGTGLDRPVTGEAAHVIRWINDSGGPVMAIDIPSGLDCDTGEPLGIAVRADHTVSFLGWKPGFLTKSGAEYAGKVHIVQIGAPRELLERFGRPRKLSVD